MKHSLLTLFLIGLVIFVLFASQQGSSQANTLSSKADASTDSIYLPILSKEYTPLSILLGQSNIEQGLYLDYGGDVDTEVVMVGSPKTEARRTGNGQILPSPGNNQVADNYMQFQIDDDVIFSGIPTTRVRIEIEYFDQGTDTFTIQYDALSGGSFGDGRFVDGGTITKANTQSFQIAVIYLCDAYFANRDNGADFRIDDRGDGAETIRRVTITLLSEPGKQAINVDSCGANPWDSNPDSDAIQACIAQTCGGDTVTFTSGVDSAGYQGYIIDKTIFLVATSPKSDLTFTSTDPNNHALLKASSQLKGFVVHLLARSRISSQGAVDDITLSHMTIDGGRDVRNCFGPDGMSDGVDDNWGSWLPECNDANDPWCSPGTVQLSGAMNWGDPTVDYLNHPEWWSTGIVVDDIVSMNTECGTALALFAAASTIKNSTIMTAGDHVHGTGCTLTDDDEGSGGWSDGITFTGPDHLITNNTIINPSDVGIVFFGGKNTQIISNTIQISSGNYGAFAGIAIHPWIFGDVSGVQVIGNHVVSEGDTVCGGLHVGINVGQHMWGGGCVNDPNPSTIGNPGVCQVEPPQPSGTMCTGSSLCQEWAYVAVGKTLTLKDNYVAGAQVNYLIEGLDLVGSLVEMNNTSGVPRLTDWYAAQNGCWNGVDDDTWGTIDKVAHHPSLPGWIDQRIHCER